MIRRCTVLFLFAFQFACVSDARAELESARLGLIAAIKGRFELVEPRQKIPWKRGVCEPWFGVYLRFSTSEEHRVLFRVLRQDPEDGRYHRIQQDPAWVVTEGAVLTGEIDYAPGHYRHVVTIDDGTPLEFDFEIVPFAENRAEGCPGPTREEARELLRAQQAA